LKIILLVAPLALSLAACATPSPEQTARNSGSCEAPTSPGPFVLPPSTPIPLASPTRAARSCDPWDSSNSNARGNRRNQAEPHSDPV